MTNKVYTYKEILQKAKNIKNNVKKEYKLGENQKWGYYIAKSIITPKKDIPKISFDGAPKPKGTLISRTISKGNYIKLAKDLVSFVKEHGRLPNYLEYGNHKIRTRVYVDMFSRILVWYDAEGSYAKYANCNSKAFIKPTETGNVVYDYMYKKTGIRFKTLDEVLTYIAKYGRYIFEFDDVRSNQEVSNCLCGNCTDWLQWLWNMAKAMGYDCKAIHVKCRVSGTGHVRGQFRHPVHTGGKWINRDPAAVADGGSITSIWCNDGIKIAENPFWFMANLNR